MCMPPTITLALALALALACACTSAATVFAGAPSPQARGGPRAVRPPAFGVDRCLTAARGVDVLFAIDASKSALITENGRPKLGLSLDFVSNTLREVNVSRGGVNVAVIAFSDVAPAVLSFNSTYSYGAIADKLAFPDVSTSHKIVTVDGVRTVVYAPPVYGPGNTEWIPNGGDAGGDYGFDVRGVWPVRPHAAAANVTRAVHAHTHTHRHTHTPRTWRPQPCAPPLLAACHHGVQALCACAQVCTHA